MISDEIWSNAKKELFSKYYDSACIENVKRMILTSKRFIVRSIEQILKSLLKTLHLKIFTMTTNKKQYMFLLFISLRVENLTAFT